jgi:hypothetical protein
MIRFSPASPLACDFIAENIRRLDREELRLTGEPDPSRAIRRAVDLSEGQAIVAFEDFIPIAVFGLAPNYLLGEGVPWMLGTYEVAQHQRELVVHSRTMVDHWLTRFPILMNEVWVGNTAAVRYLKHVGFQFAEPRRNEYGAEMALFYKRRS